MEDVIVELVWSNIFLLQLLSITFVFRSNEPKLSPKVLQISKIAQNLSNTKKIFHSILGKPIFPITISKRLNFHKNPQSNSHAHLIKMYQIDECETSYVSREGATTSRSSGKKKESCCRELFVQV